MPSEELRTEFQKGQQVRRMSVSCEPEDICHRPPGSPLSGNVPFWGGVRPGSSAILLALSHWAGSQGVCLCLGSAGPGAAAPELSLALASHCPAAPRPVAQLVEEPGR